MSAANPTTADRIRWIVNTSIEEGKAEIKRAQADPDYRPADLLSLFESALESERSGANRASLVTALSFAVIKAQKAGAKAHSGPPSSVSKSSVLSDCSSALLKLRDIIVRHEDKFAALTLGPRLQMGLQCLKAYQVFVHNPGKGGRPKKTVTRDGIPTEGFEGWLKTENEWLKKPTAYKYMEAVHGLGLDHAATEKQLAAALKTLLRKEKTVTLKSLIDRAPARLGAAEPESKEPQQTEFEFIRSNLSAFREEANTLIAIAPRLRQIPEAHRAACSRAYHLLRELTGSDWSPSETPDPLSTVDPDTITI